MTGLKHILWYQIASLCLKSTFDISVLTVKCDGLVCRRMGILVVPRGSMNKFLCGFNFPMRTGSPVFVYMLAADSSKFTMNTFLQSCGVDMRGC